MVNTCYPDWRLNTNLILTGLHTCGNLVHSVIKAFLRAEDIHLLFVVPCCYHLADESLSGRWNFSKNAKMLAQQSLERSRHKHLPSSLFYRAVLQVVLQSMGQVTEIQDTYFCSLYILYKNNVLLFSTGYCNAKVGRGGPLDNFVDYAKWALSKIGIDNKQVRIYVWSCKFIIYDNRKVYHINWYFLDTINSYVTENISESHTSRRQIPSVSSIKNIHEFCSGGGDHTGQNSISAK